MLATMRMVELIERKRDGGELTSEQIQWFVAGYTAGDIPDYQAAALLMAICLRRMNHRESVDLTLAMARSGDQLDLHDVVPYAVDKHSSGGVGDKTSLVVLPVVAACGVPVGKMSGRGLGSSGGTLDKMESIPGWTSELTLSQFKEQLRKIGVVLAGQTSELAPADGKLYALRDVTGTVGSVSLIAASIMSKKLAAGADGIVLDVKVGNGAFMETLEEARELSQLMVDIGRDAGRQVVALIADMNQPLGEAVGNALEVKEAIENLRGEGPDDLWQHSREIAGHMLLMAGRVDDLDQGHKLADEVREDGKALAKFRDLVSMQGGDPGCVDDPALLPQAPVVLPVEAPRSGYIASVNAGAIGWDCVDLGAGRAVKGSSIDHRVGMVVRVKVGDRIEKGDLLADVHAADPWSGSVASREFQEAIGWSETPVGRLPLFYETISE